MRKARDVKVHKSGNSYACYIPKDWAEDMGARRRRTFSMVYHRGVLIIRPMSVAEWAKRNGAADGISNNGSRPVESEAVAVES